MERKTRHPSRQRMIEAAETGVVGFRSHLVECDSCRTLFDLLSKFPSKGVRELHHSSPSLLKRIEAIPSNYKAKPDIPIVAGCIISDSWSQVASAQLRDVATDVTRRLVLRAGQIDLELSAERHLGKWEFAARVYDHRKATAKFVIKAGARKVQAGELGFYCWSSKRPPGKIGLLQNSHLIEFEGLSW
ncbi:MAG: hypothetical protein OEV49_15010 [candidate division Zixibacteria bacterium]|nr:hypothetical protein [candidate division Zixibacteria bacterium]MDH3936479.1 hypothetical protein [candidate division Zixibacteria bacterium]MDH4033699.1 hypothetical protein [candidate division Zixibacteria bacterium]